MIVLKIIFCTHPSPPPCDFKDGYTLKIKSDRFSFNICIQKLCYSLICYCHDHYILTKDVIVFYDLFINKEKHRYTGVDWSSWPLLNPINNIILVLEMKYFVFCIFSPIDGSLY